ncbi:hypothetical protein ACFLQJ_00820 [Calditrichota bacterium]
MIPLWFPLDKGDFSGVDTPSTARWWLTSAGCVMDVMVYIVIVQFYKEFIEGHTFVTD